MDAHQSRTRDTRAETAATESTSNSILSAARRCPFCRSVVPEHPPAYIAIQSNGDAR